MTMNDPFNRDWNQAKKAQSSDEPRVDWQKVVGREPPGAGSEVPGLKLSEAEIKRCRETLGSQHSSMTKWMPFKSVDPMWDRYFEMAFKSLMDKWNISEKCVAEAAAGYADEMLAERNKRAK